MDTSWSKGQNAKFLGTQAKRSDSNSLIIPEGGNQQQGKTSAFLPLRAMLTEWDSFEVS